MRPQGPTAVNPAARTPRWSRAAPAPSAVAVTGRITLREPLEPVPSAVAVTGRITLRDPWEPVPSTVSYTEWAPGSSHRADHSTGAIGTSAFCGGSHRADHSTGSIGTSALYGVIHRVGPRKRLGCTHTQSVHAHREQIQAEGSGAATGTSLVFGRLSRRIRRTRPQPLCVVTRSAVCPIRLPPESGTDEWPLIGPRTDPR
jgi:hypothetical protein